VFAQDYLSLRLVRLKPADEWLTAGSGLFFIFVKGGSGIYGAGAITQRLSAGDVLVWNGEAGGKLRVVDGGEVVFWCFSLSFEHLFPLFSSSEISLLRNVVDALKSARLYHAGAPVARECNRLLAEVPPQFNLDHRTQLLRIVGAILTVEFAVARPQRVGFIRIEEHMLQVFERLSSDELLTLSVGELAKKFSCSRRHLNRLFHEFFGFSVAALRMEMRLLKAVSLLRDPNIKVINVAEQCGFNHLGLFNTCFKRRFGQTPGQWRKAASPNEDHQRAGIRESAASLLERRGLAISKTINQLPAPARVNGQALHGINGSAHGLAQNGLSPQKV
jgi:AraC-like DNA-binding protein